MLRVWTLPAGQAETFPIGLPIQAVGFDAAGIWVSANGDTVLFLDEKGRTRATALAGSAGLVIFTPDGWFAGSPGVERTVRLFGDSGRRLEPSDAAARLAPDRLLAALTND